MKRLPIPYKDYDGDSALAREGILQDLLCELWDGHSVLALCIGNDMEAGRTPAWAREGKAAWIAGCRRAAETMRAEVERVRRTHQ